MTRNGVPFFYGLDQPVGSLTRWIADTNSVASYSFCTILTYVNVWEVDGTSFTPSTGAGTLSLNANVTGPSVTVSSANGTIDLIGRISGSSITASAGTGSVIDNTPGVIAGSSFTASQGNGSFAPQVYAIAGSSVTTSAGNGAFISVPRIYPVNGSSQTYSSATGYLLPDVLFVPPTAGSTEPIWVEILDKNLISQGPIPFATINAVLYYNAVGSYSILCPYSDALWNIMMSGDFIVNVNWQGLFTFGGKCEQPQYIDSIPGSIGAATMTAGPFILLSGADYLALLANRIVYPTPSAAWSSQTAAGADAVSSMKLESAIKHYVNNNVGPAALSTRKVSLLTRLPIKERSAAQLLGRTR